MKTSTRSAVAALLATSLGLSLTTGCAAVYEPRSSGRVSLTVDPWSGYKVNKNGKSEPLGVTMGSLEEAVRDDPRAAEEARTASSQSTTGLGLAIGSIVAVIGGTSLVAADAFQHDKPTAVGASGLGIVVVGLGLVFTSAILTQSAHTHAFNAVNMYNDDLVPVMPIYPVGALGPRSGYPAPMPAAPVQAPMTPPGPPVVPTPAPAPPAPAPNGGSLPPIAPLPPGALPPPGTQPVPLGH